MADQIVVLQVRDPALIRYDIAEEVEVNPSLHGARVVDMDARDKLEAIRLLLDNLDISIDNIELDVDQVNLNTDELEARVLTVSGKLPDEEGAWDYMAGSSGIVNVPASGRVIGIAAATTQVGGTVSIDGGDLIPIPIPTSGVGAVDIAPRANLVAPSIVFTNTDSYLVEFLI